MPYKDYNKKLENSKKRYWENKEYINAYHREYAKNNREKLNAGIRILKQKKKAALIEHLGGKCVGCGTTEKLQFDHIDRTKKSFTIGKCMGYTLEKLIDEANKCRLLCESCHRVKTTINADTNMLYENYAIKSITYDGDEVRVTLHKAAQRP